VEKKEKAKIPAYLKRLKTAIRDHFADSVSLTNFLTTLGALTLDDRKCLVQQALILIEQNYVHLPL